MSKERGQKGKSRSASNGNSSEKPALDPFLIEKLAIIDRCLRGEAASSVKCSIAVGREVEAVRTDSRYRDNGVAILAKQAGVKAQSFYAQAALARAFPSDEAIDAALKRADENHYVLGISVLRELVQVKDDADRQQLLARCIENKLTVRQLRDELVGKSVGRAAVGRKAKVSTLGQAILAMGKARGVLIRAVEEHKAGNWQLTGQLCLSRQGRDLRRNLRRSV